MIWSRLVAGPDLAMRRRTNAKGNYSRLPLKGVLTKMAMVVLKVPELGR